MNTILHTKQIKVALTVVALILFLGCSEEATTPPNPTGPLSLSYPNIVTYVSAFYNVSPSWVEQTGVADTSQSFNYSLSPVTTGISINSSNGVISISPNTAVQSPTTYTVTASNISSSNENITATLTIEVKPHFLSNVANIDDSATNAATPNLELDGAYSVTTAVVVGAPYLFVAGYDDDGVSVFSVGNDGSLVNVTNVTNDVTLGLNGVSSVTTAVVGGTNYLFVAGQIDSGVSVFSVGNDGSLVNATNVTNDATLELLGAVSVTTAVVGGVNYLFVAGRWDDGVSVFSVGNDGSLVNVANVDDSATNTANPTLELEDVQSITTAVVGGTTYLFVAGFTDNGVSVFSVGNDGSLVNVANIDDSADSALKLKSASSVTTAVMGGTTYLFVAGFNDYGVSVFSVGNDGSLVNVANIDDNADSIALELLGAASVTTAVVDGTTYLFVAGNIDDGVSVFSVGNDGSLVNVANIGDAAALELDGAISVTTAIVGGTTYLFVAGEVDDGVSVFSVNP